MRTFTLLSLVGLAVVLTGCEDSTGPGQGAFLESVAPAPGSISVDANGTVTLRFSAAMGAGMEQYADLHEGDISGPITPMSCVWSQGMTTLTCAPDVALDPGTQYTIHVGGGMTDGSGHHADVERHGMDMGGQLVTDQMMGGMHGGQPTGTMGQAWRGPDGHEGMAFTFHTT